MKQTNHSPNRRSKTELVGLVVMIGFYALVITCCENKMAKAIRSMGPGAAKVAHARAQ